MTDLSIIIVSYNTRELLRDCLASLDSACQELAAETFVVDNASSDGSAAMTEREFPHVRLLRNARNRGFAFANNVALREAAGRYVLLLNSDTVARPKAFAQLVRFMDETPAAGYCGPRLLNDDDTHQPSARRFPTVLSAAFAMLGMARRHPRSRHALDLHALRGDRSPFRADWLTGACLLVRAQAMRRVGLLDEGFFMYFEETDWCKRMALAGWEGWYVPAAEVLHLGGRSVVREGDVEPFSGDEPRHWVSSSRRYLRRHHGLAGMVLSMLVQVVLYALIWLRHRWKRGEQSRTKARAAAASIRHLIAPACRSERTKVRAT